MANAEVVIIKRSKKGGHEAHHGGAWKVAYADFVTAMMAFLLLLWLLNATTEAQKQGIADYFSPTSLSLNSGGAGGMLDRTPARRAGAVALSVAIERSRRRRLELADRPTTTLLRDHGDPR